MLSITVIHERRITLPAHDVLSRVGLVEAPCNVSSCLFPSLTMERSACQTTPSRISYPGHPLGSSASRRMHACLHSFPIMLHHPSIFEFQALQIASPMAPFLRHDIFSLLCQHNDRLLKTFSIAVIRFSLATLLTKPIAVALCVVQVL